MDLCICGPTCRALKTRICSGFVHLRICASIRIGREIGVSRMRVFSLAFFVRDKLQLIVSSDHPVVAAIVRT